MGARMEFQPSYSPKDFVTEMACGGWQKLATGAWTDDTQMALCIADSILATSGALPAKSDRLLLLVADARQPNLHGARRGRLR